MISFSHNQYKKIYTSKTTRIVFVNSIQYTEISLGLRNNDIIFQKFLSNKTWKQCCKTGPSIIGLDGYRAWNTNFYSFLKEERYWNE